MNGLRQEFDELVTDVPTYGDLDRAIGMARQDQHRRRAVVAALTAAAAVVAVVLGVVATHGGDESPPRPIGPVITPTPTPTPAAWEPPAPLRAPATRLVSGEKDQYGNTLPWNDPRDTASAGIDIVSVGEGQDFHGGSSWRFRLAARTPPDPVGRTIAYGIVVDGDGDSVADCQIGVNNDAPEPGDLHVWVTNLRTHETTLRDGPPYGFPVEFAHPAEELTDGYPPEMQFGFLRGLAHPDPCSRFSTASRFYVWASVTRGGQVVETDYAPNAAWLPIVFDN